MASELKACPNPWTREGTPHVNQPGTCIASPSVRKREVLNGEIRFRVECGCGVKGPMRDTKEEAVAAWNKREPDKALVGALKEARRWLLGSGFACTDVHRQIDAALRAAGVSHE